MGGKRKVGDRLVRVVGRRGGGPLLLTWGLLSLLEWWEGGGRRACLAPPPPPITPFSPPLLTPCAHPGGPNSASHSSLPPFKKRELGDLYVWGSLAQVDPRGVHTAGLKPQPQVGGGAPWPRLTPGGCTLLG